MRLTRGNTEPSFQYARRAVAFTMLKGTEVVQCAIGWHTMDALEGKYEWQHRRTQFERLRDVIEVCASRKFFNGPVEADGSIFLRSEDFRR